VKRHERAVMDIATARYNGTRYDLTVTAHRGTGRGSHHTTKVPFTVISWETGGDIDPMTRGTAYIPVGTKGYPDGLVLAHMNTAGHGHHEATLRAMVDQGNDEVIR